MAWDFSTEPEFQDKLDWMRSFVREEIWPLETLTAELEFDGLLRAMAPLQEQVREQGLWAAHLDPELGGQGFGQVKLGLMHEVLGTSPIAPFAFGNAAPDSGNSEILALAGTQEQKDRYLYPLLAGDLRSAFSMTEPETAGSDPTLLRTRAVRDVPTMEHYEPSFGKLGNHAEIRYEDVRVGPEALLGEVGAGFLIAQQRLYPGRIHHCMRWLGVCDRAFDMLCEYALTREAHGSRLADKQTVQNWIADSAAQMQAARLMTLHAAWVMDTQGVRAARREISLIKFFGAEVLHDVVDRALQIHGSLGYSTDMPLEAMYRYARAARFYDGPDEVHRESVAKVILRGYEPPADGIPREHIPTRREAARERFAHLLEAVTSND